MSEPITAQQLREILSYFTGEAYGSHREWLWVLTCLKGSNPEAQEVAKEWSQMAEEKFDSYTFNATWRGIKPGTDSNGGVGIGSLIYEAKQRGYEHQAKEWTPEEKAEFARKQAEVRRREAKAEAERKRVAKYIIAKIGETCSSDLTKLVPYYQNRGIYGSIRPLNVYWSESLKVKRPDGTYQVLSGQVAPFTDVFGNVQGVHMTFIKDGVKVQNFKGKDKNMMKGPIGIADTGSAIRLNESQSGIYVLSEGIENGLSALKVYENPDLGAYAAGSASIMPSVVFPGHTRLVLIFADWGKDGEGYAHKTQASLAARGIRSFVLFPPDPEKRMDWNDMLQAYGPSVFPALGSFVS